MADEKLPFMEEEEGAEEEISPEEGSEEEAPALDVEVEVEETTEFASPTEALAAAIEEHGADPEQLIAWFDEYGYELVKKGGEGDEMGMEMEEGPMVMDLVSLRNNAAAKAFPGDMA
jgi:hypothetical protein